MRKAKKPKVRTSTATEQSRLLAAAMITIKPPSHIFLQALDKKFFSRIIAERANGDWTDHEIDIAALMARAMGNQEREEKKIHKEGMIHKTKNKYPILNNRKAAVQLYASMVISYRRSLSLTARAQGESPANIAKRNDNAKTIQSLAQDLDDDLFARPGRAN